MLIYFKDVVELSPHDLDRLNQVTFRGIVEVRHEHDMRFNIFAARLLERRIRTEYAERLSTDRQNELLRELERSAAEGRSKAAKREKEMQRKKDKKRYVRPIPHTPPCTTDETRARDEECCCADAEVPGCSASSAKRRSESRSSRGRPRRRLKPRRRHSAARLRSSGRPPIASVARLRNVPRPRRRRGAKRRSARNVQKRTARNVWKSRRARRSGCGARRSASTRGTSNTHERRESLRSVRRRSGRRPRPRLRLRRSATPKRGPKRKSKSEPKSKPKPKLRPGYKSKPKRGPELGLKAWRHRPMRLRRSSSPRHPCSRVHRLFWQAMSAGHQSLRLCPAHRSGQAVVLAYRPVLRAHGAHRHGFLRRRPCPCPCLDGLDWLACRGAAARCPVRSWGLATPWRLCCSQQACHRPSAALCPQP